MSEGYRKILLKEFLEIYFFDDWRVDGKRETSKKLELIVSPVCNTKCSYCYYKNYGDELYNPKLATYEVIIENCNLLFDWLEEEEMRVYRIDIFSGEIFNLPYYRQILDRIREYFVKMNIKGTITIPTNSTFLFDKNKTIEIEQLIKDFKKDGIRIPISHSVDGKLLDNNTRAIRNGTLYSDEFYDNLFKFAEKNGSAFHPMISAESISKWVENYDWYINNLIETSLTVEEAFKKLYLLEVRNPNWTEENLLDLEKFIHHIIEDTFQRYGRDAEKYVNDFIFKGNLNLFSSTLFTIGRGIGCSEQMDFGVRLGDLAIPPCHRGSYDGFNGGRLVKKDGKIIDIEPENPEIFILYKTADIKDGPICSSCVISELCSLPCLGANMEVNKDFFIPVSTVCKMEFVKTYAIVKGFMEIGIFKRIISRLKESSPKHFQKKLNQLIEMESYINKEGIKNGFYRS